MPIDLGQETITIQKNLTLYDVHIRNLSNPGKQEIYIRYSIDGESSKEIIVIGYDYYDLYMNKWTDGRAIINKIKEVENLQLENIDLVVAEHQFTEGLPTEAPIIEPPVE